MNKQSLNILFLGASNPSTTTAQRAKALERIGCTVVHRDPWDFIYSSYFFRVSNPFHYRTGYRFIQSLLIKWVESAMKNLSVDLVWIDSGELLGPSVLHELKQLKCPIILYNNDNPTSARDGHRFDSLRNSVHLYDLCVVRSNVNLEQFVKFRPKSVMPAFMSYDEIVHSPFQDINQLDNEFRADVVFVGTHMDTEGRDIFILKLINAGISVNIWGDRWNKSQYFGVLKNYYRGGSIVGRNYTAALQGAKLCLGFVSKGNSDKHTRRSLEVPYAGSVLCAERTEEHLAMYRDGEEAVFWNSVEECIEVCKDLLENENKREKIRRAGYKRVRQLEMGNESLCRRIIEVAFSQNRPLIVPMNYPLYK